jgi:HAD superfamily hydrolase (TIGR01509 family)
MKWLRRFQLFLFDFDGLLVNTEHLHYQAYVTMLSKRGYQLDWSFGEYFARAQETATAIREGLYTLFPGLEPDWSMLYEEKKEEYMTLLLSGNVELMPGVERLLRELATLGIRRVVVTHSLLDQTMLMRRAHPILQTIPHWITREDYEKPKPDSECYLQAIRRFGQKGDRIIGFEDTIRGLKALQGTPALPVLISSSNVIDVLRFTSFETIPSDALA